MLKTLYGCNGYESRHLSCLTSGEHMPNAPSGSESQKQSSEVKWAAGQGCCLLACPAYTFTVGSLMPKLTLTQLMLLRAGDIHAI